MKIWNIIAETLGTDGEYYTEVYNKTSSQSAGELASSLIADMCETVDVQGVDPTSTWEIGGNEWFYRVRIQDNEFKLAE
jgi:hypothetical protein